MCYYVCKVWAHTCRPAQMSHLDRQTTDWSWTKAGREKTKKERVVLVKVVKSFFYFFMKQQQLPTTWVRRSLRLDERLNILRIPPLLLFEKTWTVYSSVCAFWKITTVPSKQQQQKVKEDFEDRMIFSVHKFVKGGRDQKFIKLFIT